MKLIKATLVIAAVLSQSALAAVSVLSDNQKTITLKVTEQYVLGDNDTLTDAKHVVIEQAKKSASDYAGSYVESELQVLDSKITKQQIRVLSAGFLEIISSNYKRSVNQSGSIVLDATADIKLSKESIRDGLAKLKNDPERQAKVDSLTKDNARLRNELFELTTKINSTDTSRTDLMKARETILESLETNREATKQVFEEGTLFQLAVLDDQAFELAKKDIEENLYGYLKHEMKIDLGTPKFYKNSQGNYDIAVPVSWNAKKSPAEKILAKHFVLANSKYIQNGHMGKNIPYVVGFSRYKNSGDYQRQPYTEKLMKFVSTKDIAIKINAGKHIGYLPIGTKTGGMGHPQYAIQFSNDSAKNIMVRNNYRNPVIIKNIPEEQLKKITALNAEVVVYYDTELARWKYD